LVTSSPTTDALHWRKWLIKNANKNEILEEEKLHQKTEDRQHRIHERKIEEKEDGKGERRSTKKRRWRKDQQRKMVDEKEMEEEGQQERRRKGERQIDQEKMEGGKSIKPSYHLACYLQSLWQDQWIFGQTVEYCGNWYPFLVSSLSFFFHISLPKQTSKRTRTRPTKEAK
jgi:hypothetical protein